MASMLMRRLVYDQYTGKRRTDERAGPKNWAINERALDSELKKPAPAAKKNLAERLM